jgi:ABC-2 type transport system permease protein
VTGLTAAVGFEWLKFRRSTVAWIATTVLVVVVPGLSAGLHAAAHSDSDGQLAAKARAMVTEDGWSGQLVVSGQILSVAVFVVVGIVGCWIFGREFTDRAVAALASLPVSRGQIATAKFIVMFAWATATVAAVICTTVLIGLPEHGAQFVARDWMMLGRLAVATLLMTVLTTPLALTASIGRGYLAGISVLLVLIVLTQIATVLGAGGWFPYAAPGLWLGMGGFEAATQINPAQLLSALPLSMLGVAATIAWWSGSAFHRHD